MVPIECATTASAGPKRQKTASRALANSTPLVRPGPAGPWSESPVGGCVEHDHAVAGLHERWHQRGELRAAASPPVHQVDRPGGTVAPDQAADRVTLRLDLERRTPLRHREVGHPRRGREPQVAGGPTGLDGRDRTEVAVVAAQSGIPETNDRAFIES